MAEILCVYRQVAMLRAEGENTQAQDGAGGDLAIVCPNPDLRRLLEITGLDAVFVTTDDRSQALAALAGSEA